MDESKLMIDEVMALIFERASQTQTLWTMYILAAIGVLGYVAATTSTSSSVLVRAILMLGFTCFAFVNCKNLIDVHFHKDQLIQIAHLELENTQTSSKDHWRKILNRLQAGSYGLVPFHAFMDVLVLLIIWSMPGTLLSLRPLFHFRDKTVRPIRSQLQPAVISWDQSNQHWQLACEYSVESQGIQFKIPKGFEFDLASIPRPLWPLIGPMELSVVAPLTHDFIYFHRGKMPQGTIICDDSKNQIERSQADNVFLDLMEREGVTWFRRTMAYYAVHLFGDKFWRNPSS